MQVKTNVKAGEEYRVGFERGIADENSMAGE